MSENSEMSAIMMENKAQGGHSFGVNFDSRAAYIESLEVAEKYKK